MAGEGERGGGCATAEVTAGTGTGAVAPVGEGAGHALWRGWGDAVWGF